MKKNILFLTLTLFISTSCSKTWSGIKQDTRDAVDNTKEVIHEATAPDPVIQDVPQDNKMLPHFTAPVETVKKEVVSTPKTKILPSIAPVQTVKKEVINQPAAIEPSI